MEGPINTPIRWTQALGKLAAKTSAIKRRLKTLAFLSASGQHRPDGPESFPLQDWWTPSYWEPTVALAIRDHCRPGDVVFDVGCNAGGMALMMSRLVGPRGIVLAFEASPRIIDKTNHNLIHAGCHNVTLFHRAVWHTTGAQVHLAAGSHLNDRIAEGATGMPVRTIALDDLATAGNFRPGFIKMDIEGAEFDALRGMPRLLAEARPVLVLEQSPDDMRCHALLTGVDYLAMDLATYRRIRVAADFPHGVGVANVLFVPREQAAGSRYISAAEPELVAELPAERFHQAKNGDIRMPEPVSLPAGRYLVHADFTAEGTDNSAHAGVEADGEVIFRYHTFTRFLAESYADWVIQLERPALVALYLRFLSGSDPTLRWRGATIRRLPAFDGWTAPVME